MRSSIIYFFLLFLCLAVGLSARWTGTGIREPAEVDSERQMLKGLSDEEIKEFVSVKLDDDLSWNRKKRILRKWAVKMDKVEEMEEHLNNITDESKRRGAEEELRNVNEDAKEFYAKLLDNNLSWNQKAQLSGINDKGELEEKGDKGKGSNRRRRELVHDNSESNEKGEALLELTSEEQEKLDRIIRQCRLGRLARFTEISKDADWYRTNKAYCLHHHRAMMDYKFYSQGSPRVPPELQKSIEDVIV